MSHLKFIDRLFSQENNRQAMVSAKEIMGHSHTPQQLVHPIKSPKLEEWFVKEAKRRLSSLQDSLNRSQILTLLEKPNRYPDGSMRLISLDDLFQMGQFYDSPNGLLNRTRQGVELLKDNKICPELGTIARGVPGGGASSRAAKWSRLHPEIAKRLGITEETPRSLFRVNKKTLLQYTIDFSLLIARKLKKVFPNVVMTNSENVHLFLETMRTDWKGYHEEELENTILLNQIVLPRMWVKDKKIIKDKLYPAGHGDYPYLLAKYHIVRSLNESGIKYLVFSNADEWLWQADPVMISIAHEFFQKGHHMIVIGTKNTNNQFGGGFVKKEDGSNALVETPRLPWDIVKSGQAPVALNTTFYIIDVDYLSQHEENLLNVEKSLVVKEVPGRSPGGTEQIIGVDSWAGDCFSAVLNPVFIEWPRLNFLGIKDGGFISDSDVLSELGNRSYQQYIHETVDVYPDLMSRLIDGDHSVAASLYNSRYSYIS